MTHAVITILAMLASAALVHARSRVSDADREAASADARTWADE